VGFWVFGQEGLGFDCLLGGVVCVQMQVHLIHYNVSIK